MSKEKNAQQVVSDDLLEQKYIVMMSFLDDLFLELDQVTANQLPVTFETAFEICMEHDHYEDAEDRIALLRIKRVLNALKNVFGDTSPAGYLAYQKFRSEIHSYAIQSISIPELS